VGLLTGRILLIRPHRPEWSSLMRTRGMAQQWPVAIPSGACRRQSRANSQQLMASAGALHRRWKSSLRTVTMLARAWWLRVWSGMTCIFANDLLESRGENAPWEDLDVLLNVPGLGVGEAHD
jgi:hypothetical protein